MSESLETVKFGPLRSFGVVNLQFQWLYNVICPSTKYNHQSVKEYRRVLISAYGLLLLYLARGSHPVPVTVSVSSKTVGIVEGNRIGCTTSKDHHHAICGTHVAQTGTVVHTRGG